MNYSISSIETVAACDALILMVSKDKSDHEFRKLSLTRQYESLSSNSMETSADLAQINSELATIIPLIDTLSSGDYKNDLISKKLKLEAKKFDLENKVADYDMKVKIEKELDINNAESQIANANALLAALDARRTELSS
jgi:hypothetical protein